MYSHKQYSVISEQDKKYKCNTNNNYFFYNSSYYINISIVIDFEHCTMMEVDFMRSLPNNEERHVSLIKPKIKAEKRTTPLEDSKDTAVVKKKSLNPCSLSSKQVELVIKARLSSAKTAVFQYEDNINDCYLYKVLNTKKHNHMKYLENQNIHNLQKVYGTPWNNVEFTFHYNEMQPAYDTNDKVCLLEKCIGDICELTLRVIHYDFTNPKTQKRKVGINIKVTKIKTTGK